MSYRRDGQFRNARQDRILRQQSSLNQTLEQQDRTLEELIFDIEFDLAQRNRNLTVVEAINKRLEALEERFDFEAKDGYHIR